MAGAVGRYVCCSRPHIPPRYPRMDHGCSSAGFDLRLVEPGDALLVVVGMPPCCERVIIIFTIFFCFIIIIIIQHLLDVNGMEYLLLLLSLDQLCNLGRCAQTPHRAFFAECCRSSAGGNHVCVLCRLSDGVASSGGDVYNRCAALGQDPSENLGSHLLGHGLVSNVLNGSNDFFASEKKK